MRYTWSESKRRRNVKEHGLDFADAPDGVTYTFEDDRLDFVAPDSEPIGTGAAIANSRAGKPVLAVLRIA